jgi:SAM-dependent methyltransferase
MGLVDSECLEGVRAGDTWGAWYDYDRWRSVGGGTGWTNGTRQTSRYDDDAHVDLGCGKIKKGRIGIDRAWAPGVSVVMDLDTLEVTQCAVEPNGNAVPYSGYTTRGLPFPDSTIRSIITHHCFEHVGDGFVSLVEECYRVLEPGGILRVITPLFPSTSAVEDPDHRRYFMQNSWNFCQGKPEPGGHWHESFAVPYTVARFTEIEKEMTPRTAEPWSPEDSREIRITLRAEK